MEKATTISCLASYTTGGKLLDIGASYGGFMYRMKTLGWQVKGIEMNEQAATFGRNELKLDIKTTDLENFHTDELFDIITLRMVLEHVPSPKATLEKVHQMLKPNGQIIFSVPDFSGVEAQLYKSYAHTLHCPMHFTHFTPKSIREYLKITGFNTINIYHQYTDRDFIAPLSYLDSDGKGKPFVQKIMSSKLFRKTILRVIVRTLSIIGKTSRMTIYATRC